MGVFTRRDALALGTVGAGIALSQSTIAYAQSAKPEWGEWVSHVDTTNSAKLVSDGLKAAETAATVLFDRMAVELHGNTSKTLAGSVALAGHCPIKLPPEYPLNGFLLIARGDVAKTPDTDATLTISLGGDSQVRTWQRNGRIVDVSTGKPLNAITEHSFELTCFSGEANLAVGSPRTWPTLSPLSLSIGISARRRTVDEEISVKLTNIEIVILAMPASRRV
jgi:hypothetical protein